MDKSLKIGIVGVGRMGANIGRRLRDLGYPVAAVFDMHTPLANEIGKELGAQVCGNLAEVTRLSDVILTVVTDDAAMHAIFASKGDSLLTASTGKVFINCATLTPQVHVDVEKLAAEQGAMTIEACMASSIPQAREGTLYLMVAGDQRAFERVKPLLEGMSKSLRHVGKTGDAAKVKALVNMVMNINTAGLAEGLGLGAAMGLDLDMLREVFSQTGANSRVLETDGGDMQTREHECYFSAAHAAKDSGIALQLARDYKVRAPLGEATKAQYDRMVKNGLGEIDKSGIAELTFPGRKN
jgi:3-hydroxyisobutyrate dehydrogenase-like beta-hydroxyacid dehydrogenase